MTEFDFNIMNSILDGTLVLKSNLKISEWWESRMISPPDSPYAGRPISYNDTPWWREPVDCLHPNHPARKVSVMSQAQGGKTTMVILPNICYTIDQDPANIIYLTGVSGLSPEATAKLEFAIEACGLQKYITPNRVKAKNNRTGDTIKKKEFKGYDIKIGNLNDHNFMRQHTASKLIGDDISAAAVLKAMTGDTIGKFETRAKSHEDTAKILLMSTPQVKGYCNIEKQIDKSDKRLYFVECPHCGTLERRIDLCMPFQIEGTKEWAGLTWKLDRLGKVEHKSVGYICQLCSRFFTDQNKYEQMLGGLWRPTQVPKELNHFGFKLNGLYSAPGMTSWFTLANKWHELNPASGIRNESEWHTFMNDDVGNVYELPTETLKATELMKNSRSYAIGTIPESVSEADGNGDIVLLDMTCDCNGNRDDARIDCEVKAWSRAGASYSVEHFSLGTFIPNQSQEEKAATTREKWSYELKAENNVWKLMDKAISKLYTTDTGRTMKIYITGIDVGHLTDNCYEYINSSNHMIIGLMGDKEHDFVPMKFNVPIFSEASSRSNLYMVNVNMVKDDLSNRMKLKWDKKSGQPQPHLFMNFPQYDYDSFFSHYESEERKPGERSTFMWQKKGHTLQNHFWDVGVYHIAIIEILLWGIFEKGLKDPNYSWQKFTAMFPQKKKMKSPGEA